MITSHGRSGTHWLARELNRSVAWTVYHEDEAWPLRHHEGAVNSHYRTRWDVLNRVGKVGVIIRDPMDIARSVWGRSPKRWVQFLSNLDADLCAVQRVADLGRAHVIRFEHMVCGPREIVRIGEKMGIFDLVEERVDMSNRWSTSAPLDAKKMDQVRAVAGWFMEKHGYS